MNKRRGAWKWLVAAIVWVGTAHAGPWAIGQALTRIEPQAQQDSSSQDATQSPTKLIGCENASAQNTATQNTATQNTDAQSKSPANASSANNGPTVSSETHISPHQAKELFGAVDELLKFASHETGLPIRHEVKRRLTNRTEIESYLKGKFKDDEDAKRMQHGEIVLKKFGLLDRGFDLRPFLMALLTEQIAGYYDEKTRTVNLLDWLDAEAQKPVLAHELTHALQDQHTDLKKWNNQTSSEVSQNAKDDQDHIARDEMDSAREAVLEGQAMAVFVDYSLKPLGKTIVSNPEVVEKVNEQMSASEDSPVMARAPLLLSESMLFPYQEGLSFEQEIWIHQGQTAAFAGALDRPPTSSWEIINPIEYEKRHLPSVPLMPDVHPLTDKLYKPYDIGQVGQLDLQILTELFGGEEVSRELTEAWEGGIYWAGQRRNATVAEQSTPGSIALFYLSEWKSTASAVRFAHLYAEQLGRKYSGVKHDDRVSSDRVEVYSTNEGPVTITTRGKLIFITESFDLDLARKLSELMLDAQGVGELREASLQKSSHEFVRGGRQAATGAQAQIGVQAETLTAPFRRFFSATGMMKFAAEVTIKPHR